MSGIGPYVRRHHVGLIALFVALGGTSYAAVQLPRNSVGSEQLRKGAVGTSDIRKGAVTFAKINGKALDRLAAREGPAGPPGPEGPPGATGPKGDTGTVDTSGFYTKSDSDARFLSSGGKAADSALFDGKPATDFIQGTGSVKSLHTHVAFGDGGRLDAGGVSTNVTCGSISSVLEFRNQGGAEARIFAVIDGVASAAQTVPHNMVTNLDTIANGDTSQAVIQVAWGPALDRLTAFVVSIRRAGGCPVEVWGTAVTNG